MLTTPIHISIPSFLPSHPWHPSVVYVSGGWNGHRWWMAETPFPPFNVRPYKDRWELPCIHYSDDGINWNSIDENPIDDISEDQISNYGYLSDPHLILVNDVLYCYYRLMSDWDKQTTIYLKRSKDGIHWSDREVVCSVASAEREIVSPAIVCKDGKFRMYYVDGHYTNLNRGIQMCESMDGVHFDEPRKVKYPTTYMSNPIIPWHIDVQCISEKVYMVLYDQEQESLFFLQSIDGIHFETQQKLLQVSKRWGGFYNQKLYRACYVEAGQVSRVYFSATNGESSHIGLMELQSNGDWHVVDCRKGTEHFVFIITMLWQDVYKSYKKIRHIVAQKLKRIFIFDVKKTEETA